MTVAVEEGTVTPCGIELNAGAAVAGVVRGLKSGERGRVMIRAGSVNRPDTPAPDTLDRFDRAAVRAFELEPDGTFRIEGLEPGHYTVVAWVVPSPVSGMSANELLERTRMTSEEVTVDEGDEASVRIRLP